jgi:chemotaxis protein histidine kinase CheA
LIQQIFKPGFSTASEISEISGRGVGLDVVKTGIEEAGGSIAVTSKIGHGSTFEITLPSKPNPR